MLPPLGSQSPPPPEALCPPTSWPLLARAPPPGAPSSLELNCTPASPSRPSQCRPPYACLGPDPPSPASPHRARALGAVGALLHRPVRAGAREAPGDAAAALGRALLPGLAPGAAAARDPPQPLGAAGPAGAEGHSARAARAPRAGGRPEAAAHPHGRPRPGLPGPPTRPGSSPRGAALTLEDMVYGPPGVVLPGSVSWLLP